jgi:5-carboxymethyl-2-hydroxymuconic-semialdehyde dehydrogenase
MIYSLNGERCTSSSRVLIERSIYDEFTAKIAERAKKIKIGHPLDPKTEVGPLVNTRHVNKVSSYVDLAQNEGATIAAGGKANGNYFEPTLFTHAHCNMRIAQEEIFGPVLTAIPFDNDDEALAYANSVNYGLTAYIWTQNITRGLRFAHEVEAGMVWVNSENVRYLPTPFGGVKASGIGRDGGDYSFDFYMETKNIAIALGAHKVPKLG